MCGSGVGGEGQRECEEGGRKRERERGGGRGVEEEKICVSKSVSQLVNYLFRTYLFVIQCAILTVVFLEMIHLLRKL